MKALVNLVQLAIVLAILYPVYYLWDTDRVDNFCQTIKVGTSKEELIALADEHKMPLQGPTDMTLEGGQWIAKVAARSSFSGYSCAIKGAADAVASAEIIRGEEE